MSGWTTFCVEETWAVYLFNARSLPIPLAVLLIFLGTVAGPGEMSCTENWKDQLHLVHWWCDISWCVLHSEYVLDFCLLLKAEQRHLNNCCGFSPFLVSHSAQCRTGHLHSCAALHLQTWKMICCFYELVAEHCRHFLQSCAVDCKYGYLK